MSPLLKDVVLFFEFIHPSRHCECRFERSGELLVFHTTLRWEDNLAKFGNLAVARTYIVTDLNQLRIWCGRATENSSS